MSAVDWIFVACFAVAGVYEIKGVLSKRRNDTISEMAWWLRRHFPPGFWAVMVLVFWLPGHFLYGGS